MIRTLNEVIENLRTGLANSKLARFSTYSNVYALFRSIGSVITQHEVELDSIKDGFFLSTASGDDLDRRAGDYEIYRNLGSPSYGSVLVKAGFLGTGPIPAGTILTSANNLIQVETTEPINIVGLNEVAVEVVSLSLTQQANLPAGTSLYSSIYPQFTFTVGRYRNPLNLTIEGNLSGGREGETDIQFSTRIRDFQTSLAKATNPALVSSILNVPTVTRVFIKEHKPSSSYMTVYINSNNAEVVRRVDAVIAENKAAGVSYIIRPLDKVDLVVALELEVNRNSNINKLIEDTRATVYSYLDNVEVEGLVSKEAIAGVALRVPGVSNVRVLSPTNSIVLQAEQIVNVSDVIINSVISR